MVSWPMFDIRRVLRLAARARQPALSADDKQQIEKLVAWQQSIIVAVTDDPEPFQPPVQMLADYLGGGTSDGIARQYANQMLSQYRAYLQAAGFLAPQAGFQSVDQWLAAINYTIQRSPRFNGQNFPMSSLFVFVMFTPSGAALFRMREFNALLRSVLQTWCAYLDTKDSREVLIEPDGWLSEPAQQQLCLEQSVNYLERDKPYWGFESFNGYFHREYQLDRYRPLSGPDDDRVIVSANDGTVYRVARNVKLCDTFWTKGQEYSLVEMLDGSPYTESFVGGDVLQSFLSGSDYHRWHAPISGTVREVRVIPGLMFSELLSEGFDVSAGTESQGYEVMVNTRGLVIIENQSIGKVAVLPVGITEISSITMTVRMGQNVEKGQELGYFSYGGSTLALVFQRGMIREFTAKVSDQDTSSPRPACKTVEDCRACDGCLRVRDKVAEAS